MNYEVPQDVAALRRFLALARYYQRYIPMLSALAAPLTRLTSPYARFVWGENEQAAFEAVQSALLNCAALSAPRNDRPLYVTTDASDLATGYVVEQYDDTDHCGGWREDVVVAGELQSV